MPKFRDQFRDFYDIVQRHDEDEGDIFYEIRNYHRDVCFYIHGGNAKSEAERVCKALNKSPAPAAERLAGAIESLQKPTDGSWAQTTIYHNEGWNACLDAIRTLLSEAGK